MATRLRMTSLRSLAWQLFRVCKALTTPTLLNRILWQRILCEKTFNLKVFWQRRSLHSMYLQEILENSWSKLHGQETFKLKFFTYQIRAGTCCIPSGRRAHAGRPPRGSSASNRPSSYAPPPPFACRCVRLSRPAGFHEKLTPRCHNKT